MSSISKSIFARCCSIATIAGVMLGLSTLVTAQGQPQKKQPKKKQPKQAPANNTVEEPLSYPKLEEMQLPTVKELFEQEPRCWVVLKNQDVIVAEPVNPRPDTVKRINERIEKLRNTQLPPPGDARDKLLEARREAPFLPVSVYGPGENPEKKIHVQYLDRVIHHEDLMLRRIGQLQDDGELALSFSLLFKLKRRIPTWPTIEHYENRQLFTEARLKFDKEKNPISALFRLERIHDNNPKFAGLKEYMGEVADFLITKAIAAKDYRRARHYIGRLRKRESEHEVYLKWRDRLLAESTALLNQARTHAKAGRHDQAATAAMAAVEIWPATPGLRGAYDAMTRRFQTLNVGVINFPGENPAYFLPTVADRRQKYLTQTSMFEAKGFTVEPTHDDTIHYQTRYFIEWEPNDLGRKTMFRLKAQRDYFDPQPAVTSSDIAATLRARLDPKNHHYDERLASYVKSFTVHSPTLLEIQFSRVPARLESVLNFPLIRQKSPQSASDSASPVSVEAAPLQRGKAPDVDSPRFAAYEPGKWTATRRVFRRFVPEPENVPENRYHVAQVVELKFPSHKDAIQALKRGRIQMLAHVRPWEVDQLRKDERFDVRQYALPTTHVIQFNPESDTLKSREMRRALRYALDRESMLRRIALRAESDDLGPQPKGRVISAPFPSINYATKLGVKPLKYDLVLAMALKVVMNRAHERVHYAGLGTTMTMGVAPLAAKQGWMPTLKMLVPPGDVIRKVAEKCVENWDRIGIKVEIVTQAPSGATPQWDMVYRTVKMVDPVVDLWPFLTFDDRARVETLTHLPDWLRQELIRLDVARDWAQVTRSLNQLHEHMQLQALMIPLFEVDDYLAIRRTVSAFRDPRLRPVHTYQNIERWIVNPWYPPNTP